jgi:hypothetical protein
MKTFLLLTLGTRVAYDPRELPSPRHDKANDQVKQVVEVSRCPRPSEPERIKLFYCVVSDEIINAERYSTFSVVPEGATMCNLAGMVHGRKAKLESWWMLKCSVCSRSYIVSRYVK